MADVPHTPARRGRHAPDPRVVDMPDEYLECRIASHRFPDFAASAKQRVREYLPRGTVDTVHIEAQCERCGTVRRTVRNLQTWAVMRTVYDYPDGYANPEPGYLGRDTAGLEMLRRYPPDDA